MTPRKYVNWQNQIEQIWLNEIIEYQFMKKRKFPYVRLITWIQIRFYKRISRIFDAILRFSTWFAINEKKNMWNWIMQIDLHLISYDFKWNEYSDFHCIYFDGKIREIEYYDCTSFAFDLTEKFVKLNIETWFPFKLTEKFVKMNTPTRLPLHCIWFDRKIREIDILKHDLLLIWRKNLWNWILKLDSHLNWRKNLWK